MDTWKRLSNVNVSDKQKFQRIFVQTFNKVKNGKLKLKAKESERKDYFLIIEENRLNSWFVHIVPKEIYPLFKEMQSSSPNSFLGFSVVASTHEGKEVRVSCFGVPCDLLAKSLANSTKRTWSYRWVKKRERRGLKAW